MPRVRPKVEPKGRRPFKPGEKVRAVSAAFVAGEEGDHYVHTGQLWEADHEAVRSVPGCFVPADLPANEIHLWLEEPAPPPQHRSEFNIAQPREIPPERMVIALEGIGSFSRFVSKGEIVSVDDEFVAMHPGCFSIYRPLSAADVEELRGNAAA